MSSLPFHLSASVDLSSLSSFLSTLSSSLSYLTSRVSVLESSLTASTESLSLLTSTLSSVQASVRDHHSSDSFLTRSLELLIVRVDTLEGKRVEGEKKSEQMEGEMKIVKERMVELGQGIGKTKESMLNTEQKMEERMKALEWMAEGTEARVKGMHAGMGNMKKDVSELQEEIVVALGRLEKLNGFMNQAQINTRNLMEQKIASKVEVIENNIPELKYQIEQFKAFQDSLLKNGEHSKNELLNQMKNENESNAHRIGEKLKLFEKHVHDTQALVESRVERDAFENLRMTVNTIRMQLGDSTSIDQAVDVTQRLSSEYGQLRGKIKDLENNQSHFGELDADIKKCQIKLQVLEGEMSELLSFQAEQPISQFVPSKGINKNNRNVDDFFVQIQDDMFNLRQEMLHEIESSIKLINAQSNSNSSLDPLAQKVPLRCLSCDKQQVTPKFPIIKYTSKFLNQKRSKDTRMFDPKTLSPRRSFVENLQSRYAITQHEYTQPVRRIRPMSASEVSMPTHSARRSQENYLPVTSSPMISALKPHVSFAAEFQHSQQNSKATHSNMDKKAHLDLGEVKVVDSEKGKNKHPEI